MNLKLFVLILYTYSVDVTLSSFRLPPIFSPSSYELSIKLDPNVTKTNRFYGEVTIIFKVCVRYKYILLHTKNLKFKKENVTLMLDNSKPYHHPIMLSYDAPSEIMKFQFSSFLKPSTEYKLVIQFSGKVNSHVVGHGLYRVDYTDRTNKKRYLFITTFEPHFARMVFPNFDEPELRAPITLAVTRPESYMALSNANESKFLKEEDSPESSPLFTSNFFPLNASSFMVGFVVGELTCDCYTGATILIRVCSLRDTAKDDRVWALSLSERVIKFLESYLDIPYNKSTLTKLDVVGVPDYRTASENWGIIILKEELVLYNKEKSSMFQKQDVACSLTHEIAHSWFGNLVNVKWWDDIFISEGISTFFHLLILKELESHWYVEQQFIGTYMQKALEADSTNDSWALSAVVLDPDDFIRKYIPPLGYWKGACIVRMMYYIMGENHFRSGLQKFLNNYEFQSADINDFLHTMEESAGNSINFTTFSKTWIDQPGYPLLRVKLVGTDVIITQERFLPGNERSNSRWFIPITYTTQAQNDFRRTTPKVWFSHREKELKLLNVIKNESDWIIINNHQLGFFRVHYDDELWRRIHKILRRNPKRVHVNTRAQLINDLYSLAKYDKISMSDFLDRIDFLKEDTGYFSWLSAFARFADILGGMYDSHNRKRFLNFIEILMEKFYQSASQRPTKPIPRLKNILSFKWACRVGKPSCIAFSKHSFGRYKQDQKINRDLAYSILCNAIYYSKDPREDTDTLYKIYLRSNVAHEKFHILKAFTCIKEKRFLEKYIDILMQGIIIRLQKNPSIHLSEIILQPQTVDIVVNYLSERLGKFFKRCATDESCLVRQVYVMGLLCKTQKHIEKFRAALQKLKISPDAKRMAHHSLSAAQGKIKTAAAFEKRIDEYFDKEHPLNFAPTVKSKLSFVCVIFFLAKLF